MKKFLFPILLFGATVTAGHALTCVPKTGTAPSTPNYLQYWNDTYLQCGGGGGESFHKCAQNVIVEGWDGNLHKCTKNGWETVDNIKVCEGELQEIEQKYNGLSNMGTLFANNQAQKNYLYYYDENEKDGYTAIKNYCNYNYKEFKQELAKCTGDFLHWNDDGTVTLCDVSSASSSTASAPSQSTKLTRPSKEINCKNTGGDRYDAKNGLCVCNAEENT